jgi:ATP-dependent DNA helicase RecQ
MAPFMVAHDVTLLELSRQKPTTAQQLMGIKGFGPKKIETYGQGILQTIGSHTGEEVRDPNVWTAKEDSQMVAAFRKGTPLGEAATALGREPAQLWARLSELNRMNSEK